jgi:hypothetical protein
MEQKLDTFTLSPDWRPPDAYFPFAASTSIALGGRGKAA